MVNTSKILTVSYGTFSCTLEGFDDSFETMKAIAEYFRDLAADDRYFGAEPPTPDAEMLARIAEREISRRVEAHEDQGKIHLRADEGRGAAEALTHAAPVTKPADAAAPEEAEAPQDAPLAETEAAADADYAETPTQPAAVEETAPAVADVSADPGEATEFEEKPDEENIAEADATGDDRDASEALTHADGEPVDEDDAAEAADPVEADPHAGIEITDQAIAGIASEADTANETGAFEAVSETTEADHVDPADAEAARGTEADVEAFIADAAEDEAEAVAQDPSDVAPADGDAAEAATVEPQPDIEDEPTETGVELYEEVPARAVSADSVAEKLRRIRSVVSQSDLDYEVSEYSEDEHANGMMSSSSDELDALLQQPFEDADDAEDAYILDDAAPVTEDDEAAFAPDKAEEIDLEETVSDDDTLDAVMAGLEGPSEAEEAPIVEAPAEDAPVAAQEQADAIDADDDADAFEDATVVDDDTLTQLLADAMPADATPADVPEIAADLDEDMSDPLDDDEEAPESLFADLDDTLETEDEADADRSETPFVLGEDARVADTNAPEAERPLNARVLKMKRTEFETAIAQGVIEEEEIVDAEVSELDDEANLSPEEEADLQRELAEVEAELTEYGASREDDTAFDEDADARDAEAEHGDAPEMDADEDGDAQRPVEAILAEDRDAQDEGETTEAQVEQFSALSDADDAHEDDMPQKPRRGLSRLLGMGKRAPEDEERIFEEADSQMGDKDASMRRTAIQHLRAAVAATKAEKSAGVDVDQSVDDAPYRSDLAEVVRPRRPSAPGASTRSVRPSDERPAPLKLVAEQRVDTERAPVRPRRVSSMPASVPTSADGGFTAFAEEMGATRLSDLLEAAAAYMSDVEGHSEFTRPMLMGKLKEANSGDYSREDGLRSFGQLLREGKLRKVQGGRFSATDETEFRAEARNVG